jgi:hypothetical protein
LPCSFRSNDPFAQSADFPTFALPARAVAIRNRQFHAPKRKASSEISAAIGDEFLPEEKRAFKEQGLPFYF